MKEEKEQDEITRTVFSNDDESFIIRYTNKYGQLHREDGPAELKPNTDIAKYYLCDQELSQEEHEKFVNIIKGIKQDIK